MGWLSVNINTQEIFTNKLRWLLCIAVSILILAGCGGGSSGSGGLPLSGQVRTADGTPIADATIEFFGQDYFKSFTDAEGFYSTKLPGKGEFTISVQALSVDAEGFVDSSIAEIVAQSGVLNLMVEGNHVIPVLPDQNEQKSKVEDPFVQKNDKQGSNDFIEIPSTGGDSTSKKKKKNPKSEGGTTCLEGFNICKRDDLDIVPNSKFLTPSALAPTVSNKKVNLEMGSGYTGYSASYTAGDGAGSTGNKSSKREDNKESAAGSGTDTSSASGISGDVSLVGSDESSDAGSPNNGSQAAPQNSQENAPTNGSGSKSGGLKGAF